MAGTTSTSTLLGGYLIGGRLGAGAFGEVFIATDPRTQARHVLKSCRLDGTSTAHAAQALTEVMLLAEVKHERIVAYRESFVEDGKLHIFMEYCEGGDLKQYIEDRAGEPLPERIVWRYLLQTAIGLEHLHALRILHRDLKAANVFLTRTGDVKIGDLGVARLLGASTEFATTLVGSPYYLSPELCENALYDAKSDVWAFGVLAYELLALQPPFTAHNQAALVLKIVRGAYDEQPLHRYMPPLRELVRSCLQMQPERRPTIAEWLASRDVQFQGLSLRIDLPPPPSHPPPPPTTTATPSPPDAAFAELSVIYEHEGGDTSAAAAAMAAAATLDASDDGYYGEEASSSSSPGDGHVARRRWEPAPVPIPGFEHPPPPTPPTMPPPDCSLLPSSSASSAPHPRPPPASAPPARSMLPTKPPLPDSPLGKALAADVASSPAAVPPPPSKAAGQQPAAPRRLAAASQGLSRKPSTDQPVTFHKKVTSSGYGQPPVLKLHAGGPTQRAKAEAKAKAEARFGGGGGGGGVPLHMKRYVPAEGPMVEAQLSNCDACPPAGTAVMRLAYAPDASRLALAGTNGSVTLLRLPTRRYAAAGAAPPPTLNAHSAAISSVHWSHSGRLLLSASDDGSACVWDVSADRPPAAPLMRMQHVRHSPQLGVQGQAVANPTFGSEVKHAQFYYLDAMILLLSGKSLHLYSYSLLKTPANDAERAPELRHKYRLQYKWAMPRAHVATCMATPNSFLSPVVLLAGSDRSLVALDLGTGMQVLNLPDAHERPIHSLRLAEGSAFGDAPTATRDLFVSAANDSVVKLWDLRTASCVRRFEAHANHVHPIGASLSPCLRYLCCGSEDKSAYLYDTRSGGVIERLRHPEAVSDAAFSPLHPQLATSAFDGRARFFADRPEEAHRQ